MEWILVGVMLVVFVLVAWLASAESQNEQLRQENRHLRRMADSSSRSDDRIDWGCGWVALLFVLLIVVVMVLSKGISF